jgi:uncharacterized protein (TIGR02996 family)
MTTEEHFEDAIFANPEDVAVYRVYADWLREKDEDDPRAHWIDWQLDLEEDPSQASGMSEFVEENRDALMGTLATVLEDHSWTEAGLRAHVRFRRGFVHTLAVPWPTDALVRALAGWSHRRFLRELLLQDLCCRWGDTNLALAALSAWIEDGFAGLERLVLEHTWGELRSIDRLGLSDLVVQMPALRELEVRGHLLDTEETRALFSSDLRRMRSLSVPYTRQHEGALEVLMRNESAAQLQHLALYSIEDLEDALPASFADLSSHDAWLPPGLRSLRFSGFTGADARSCGSLAARVSCSHLHTLDLSDGDIDDAGVSALAQAPGIAGSTWVLRGNPVTPAGADVLRRAGARVVL